MQSSKTATKDAAAETEAAPKSKKKAARKNVNGTVQSQRPTAKLNASVHCSDFSFLISKLGRAVRPGVYLQAVRDLKKLNVGTKTNAVYIP